VNENVAVSLTCINGLRILEELM